MILTALEIILRNAKKDGEEYQEINTEWTIVHIKNLLKKGAIKKEDVFAAFKRTLEEDFQNVLLNVIRDKRYWFKHEVEVFLDLYPHCLTESQQSYLIKITIGAPERSLSAEELTRVYEQTDNAEIQEGILKS